MLSWKKDIVCAITEKRQIALLLWKNTFVVPLFYKIVRRFYVAHISHRSFVRKRALKKFSVIFNISSNTFVLYFHINIGYVNF